MCSLMVEQSAHNGWVIGSIPIICIGVSPSGKAKVFDIFMHGFDSHYPKQINLEVKYKIKIFYILHF